MDDQKNIKPDFSKAGEDSILYKKEEPKTEREKLKELHGKDKIWYLVHYYGLQTMVALAIIGTISFLIIHYVTQKDTALEIMAVNAMQSADNPAGDSGYYNDFLFLGLIQHLVLFVGYLIHVFVRKSLIH